MKTYYPPSELALRSNEELAELVRSNQIEPHMEVAARFRRATATTRGDPDSIQCRRKMAAGEANAKAEVEAMRADMAKTEDQIKLLKVQILEKGGTL